MHHRSHTELYYHFCWSTINRQNNIGLHWENVLYKFLENKCLSLRSRSIAVNGMSDHVHIILRGNASIAPAKFAHDLKGASSRMINAQQLSNHHFEWQDGYGAFTVSPHMVETVAAYIRNQKKHHKEGTSLTEWEYTVDTDENDCGIDGYIPKETKRPETPQGQTG